MAHVNRRRLLVLGSLWVVMIFLLAPASDTFGVFLLPLVRDLHCTRAQISEVAAASLLATGFLSPVSGWLLDRVAPKWMIAGGALLAASGFFIASRSHSLAMLILAYSVIGAGVAAGTMIPTSVVTVNWFENRKGIALGVTLGGMSIGIALAPPLVGRLLVHHDWREIMLWITVPMLVIVVPVVMAFVRMPDRTSGEHRAAGVLPGLEFAPALASPSFWLILLLHLCFALAWGLTFYHVVPILVGSGFSEATAATIFGLQALFAILGFIGNGLVADRFGARAAMVLSFLSYGTSLVCLSHAGPNHLVWVGAYMVLFSFAGCAPNTISPLIVAEALGMRSFGALIGILHLMAAVARSAGPIIAGHIFDVSGNYTRAFYLAFALIVTGITATWLVYPVAGRDVVSEPAAASEIALRAPSARG